jgi:hypothetical protein
LAFVCGPLAAVLAMLTVADSPAAPAPAAKKPASSKEALAEFNSLVGDWRGVGQPRRGSAVGSWAEKAEWVWDFIKPEPAVRWDVSQGKLVKSARFTYNTAAGRFQADVTLAAGEHRKYEGAVADDRLVLESKPESDEVHRLSITRLNEKRTVVLFEKGRKGARSLSRVAEVGYTREGTRLAVEGGDGPECVVTGGRGTIPVSYQGRTYYVCCTGCKQAFEENPAKILAEYKERLAARAKDAK